MTIAVRHHTIRIRRANPDRPILVCFWDARRHVHFVNTLRADIKSHAKRSKAAKKAWKTRRANAGA